MRPSRYHKKRFPWKLTCMIKQTLWSSEDNTWPKVLFKRLNKSAITEAKHDAVYSKNRNLNYSSLEKWLDVHADSSPCSAKTAHKPPHDQRFRASVLVTQPNHGSNSSRSKSDAQQQPREKQKTKMTRQRDVRARRGLGTAWLLS